MGPRGHGNAVCRGPAGRGSDLLFSVLFYHDCGSESLGRLEGSYFLSCAKASHEHL